MTTFYSHRKVADNTYIEVAGIEFEDFVVFGQPLLIIAHRRRQSSQEQMIIGALGVEPHRRLRLAQGFSQIAAAQIELRQTEMQETVRGTSLRGSFELLQSRLELAVDEQQLTFEKMIEGPGVIAKVDFCFFAERPFGRPN